MKPIRQYGLDEELSRRAGGDVAGELVYLAEVADWLRKRALQYGERASELKHAEGSPEQALLDEIADELEGPESDVVIARRLEPSRDCGKSFPARIQIQILAADGSEPFGSGAAMVLSEKAARDLASSLEDCGVSPRGKKLNPQFEYDPAADQPVVGFWGGRPRDPIRKAIEHMGYKEAARLERQASDMLARGIRINDLEVVYQFGRQPCVRERT